MEDYMKLNKKVIDSITVWGLCAMLTVTAVTNSGRSEVKAEDKVLANTGLEHTGYNSYAGVAATLFDYEKGPNTCPKEGFGTVACGLAPQIP